tara:strand:- start:53 stop:715 length:663 start_codon:yes stop_codon:yes gene_type:complete
MLNLTNPLYNGTSANISYTSDAEITFASLQICQINGGCMAQRYLSYTGLSGVATYTMTAADYNILNNFPDFELKFILHNTVGDQITHSLITTNTATGDVTGDAIINVLDIVTLVNLILDPNWDGQINSDSQAYIPYADINNDGIINILDIVNLINLVLSNPRTSVTDKRALRKQRARLSNSPGVRRAVPQRMMSSRSRASQAVSTRRPSYKRGGKINRRR